MSQLIAHKGAHYPVSRLCDALDFSKATYYRLTNGYPKAKVRQPLSPLALSEKEIQNVLDILHAKEFMDLAPDTIYASLLERGQYHCSVRTMYRILEKHGELKERRDILRHPAYKKPELLATGPNQVWSWDITKLKGPVKWTYYYLYVVMDIFSRFVVGWLLADKESSALAKQVLGESYHKQEIEPHQLTVHADRGTSMKSKCTAQFLADLGITKTHSRPKVSNDNCYSEAQFKTLKYRPEFPKRFGSIQDARAFSRSFFDWYNNHHKHSGIAYLTPADVHYGRGKEILEIRQDTLKTAFLKNPKRFKGKMPQIARLPKEVWINPPERKALV
jgi:putative transposase